MARFSAAFHEVVSAELERNFNQQACDVLTFKTADGDTHRIALWRGQPQARTASPAGPLATNHNPGPPPPVRG